MNRHQVLTGATNTGDHCYAVGSVEGNPFTAYAAGCGIVILAGDFQRVQIIPGAVHGNIQVTCIDCCTDSGKIAASYGKKVCIFEPTPLLHQNSTHRLDYRWYHTGTIESGCQSVMSLSWNQEGSKLLTGGEVIQMWQSPEQTQSIVEERGDIGFYIEDQQDHVLDWCCVWRCHIASPVTCICFSPDGLLFASMSKDDRLVKIWYENKLIQLPVRRTDSVSPKKEELNYSFVYIAHPRAVTGFMWRKTSKYMPRGSVANMLVTSCRDNICRIWSETILPEDGLVDVYQLDPVASQNPMYHTQRHKKRFMHRLHHIKHLMHKRKRPNSVSSGPVGSFIPPLLSSTQSIHDFHKFGVHPNSVAPGFHFHLAASINPDSDIPLLPTLGTSGNSSDPNFVVHWLNNKEFHFTLEAEKIMAEMTTKASEYIESSPDSGGPVADVTTEVDVDDMDVDNPTHVSTPTMSAPHIERCATASDSLKKKRSILRKSRSHVSSESYYSTASSMISPSVTEAAESTKATGADALDQRIDGLLRDWHQSADMLFSIHPVDGSFLVWLVDWLDEAAPGSFRQVQISFSSRIPQVIPLGDAISMSPKLLLYSNMGRPEYSQQSCDSDTNRDCMKAPPRMASNAMGKSSPGQNDNTSIPNVLMVSKHDNGSLNQWQISFAETSKFSTVLNIAHASRTCGHRFQTNSAACHPVLPLLVTTSHHNLPEDSDEDIPAFTKPCEEPGGFCSELILWKVDPVSSLSKSGGVKELARINSPHVSAFASIAWLPTLLPSSTLGSVSNSPSALFVASDGHSLRVYQAVIDARSILSEIYGQRKKEAVNLSHSNSSTSSGMMLRTPSTPVAPIPCYNIVSVQSTARPGCIIELDAIADAKQGWQHIQLIHVFQEQLIHGLNPCPDSSRPSNQEAMVNLQNTDMFKESFYLVVMERLPEGTTVLHMWRLVISSSEGTCGPEYSADVIYYQDGENSPSSSRSNTPEPMPEQESNNGSKIIITSSKACTQLLELPEGVSVTSATVAAGHLSSSSIYPACSAPYLISTACSDGRVRFWCCHTESLADSTQDEVIYTWTEWEMMIQQKKHSYVRVAGTPIAISCAYSGRVAVAYRHGGVKNKKDDPKSRYFNLFVSIFECESTGGSEWTLEDTIELKNIEIPDPKIEIDLSRIYDDYHFGESMDTHHTFHHTQSQVLLSANANTPSIIRSVPVPSMTTVESVKRILGMNEKKVDILKPRHLVQLDWVSTEDGSHLLTVAVGSKILLYAAVSSELSQASTKESDAGEVSKHRGYLERSKSMTVQTLAGEVCWMRIRSMELSSADGLPPLPMHVSWVRDGILVVGMDNEMHVYSQWHGVNDELEVSTEIDQDHTDDRALIEQNFKRVSSTSSLNLNLAASKSFKISQSMSCIKLDASIANLSLLAEKTMKDRDKKSDSSSNKSTKVELAKSDSISASVVLYQDCGLFEAARLANPVLPQYHPRQLIELLNFGKIRRVKAILAHLVHCISGGDNYYSDEENQQRQRPMTRGVSLSGPSAGDGSTIPEESHSDYIEIASIPPLPLYALLAADEDQSFGNMDAMNISAGTVAGDKDHYDALFNLDTSLCEDPFDSDDVFMSSPNKRQSDKRSANQVAFSMSKFGGAESQLLTRHLTHTHLPGLSSLDQMYLLALADTVANTKLDFSDKQHPDEDSKTGELQSTGQISAEMIDDCGLRYMLASRHHIYLLNTLPIGQRISLQLEGLNPACIAWAFHSESKEELLNMLPSMQKGEPTWAEFKQFGAGWWLQNITFLRRVIEKIAKTAFQVRKDPLDAALFYLAMKKKTLVWGLFRSISDTKMMTFFKNDFTEDRWRKAALKNAFALLGRQRFQHAAAFFLLGNSVRDAIEVCLNKMDDLQLAIVIARLYQSELDDSMPSNLRRLLYEECLGRDHNGQNYDSHEAHPDPFIRSMAYWMMKDHAAALGTLLETNLGLARHDNQHKQEIQSYSANPSVFNFYNYLRTHPLLLRQHLAKSATDKSKSVFLSGFAKRTKAKEVGKDVTYVDRITPVERRLFFMTAHTHFKNGCPALALEVLSKLPHEVDTEFDITKSHSIESVTPKSPLEFGALDFDAHSKIANADHNKPMIASGFLNSVDDFDWSQPVASQIASTGDTSDLFDWSQPVASQTTSTGDTSDLYDWSQPVKSLIERSEPNVDESRSAKSDDERDTIHSDVTNDDTSPKLVGDIMAQQLKFIACLKIMMEELATLATGFEVDGGQLRYQLYVWLEKEVNVLNQICNYGVNPQKSSSADTGIVNQADDEVLVDPAFQNVKKTSLKPSLHEVILAEKLDFEAKLQRLARRKNWLLANQQLIRTLLSYSVLHGSGGGGLASVRMELILLLQELQQEKTQQQLLSPLPFPTTLPLVSASIASGKTVIADPIQHLKNVVQDILHTIVEHRRPPAAGKLMSQVFALRNMAAALSACIYQCLCDSDTFVVQLSDYVDVGMEGFTSTKVVYKDSYLMAGAQRRRNRSSASEDKPNSAPIKWPGVSSLRALLARERDDDSPKLTVLLVEALISIYMSLLVHALTMYDANILYRLAAHPFTESLWPILFGGGIKKLINIQKSQPDLQMIAQSPKDDVAKHRMRLHMKVLGPSGSCQRLKEHKPTYKEKFVPPETSMINYFMTKPTANYADSYVDYDSTESISSDEEEEEEEEEEFSMQSNRRPETGQREHLDPNSYSWCLLRYAIIKYVRYTIVQFLPQIGIELQELPMCSPLVQAVLKNLERWEEVLLATLEEFRGPPPDYIPGCCVNTFSDGPTIMKYKDMLNASNTPFLSSHYSALPAKRLWHYLIHQRYLQDVFIRYIFKHRKCTMDDPVRLSKDETDDSNLKSPEAVKIIHKDLDSISTFCINQANLNCIAMATPKDIIEMDITGILYPPKWLDDDTEYDIENIRLPSPNKAEGEEFLVIETVPERMSNMPPSAPGVIPAPSGVPTSQSGRSANVLAKRSSPGVRRMGAHPHLPYYLSGAQDGSVRLWEWGHSQCISVARQSGTFPKVSRVLFNAQGNKFGVADSEGSVCLWQVGLGVNMSKPYLSLKCHNKTASDFSFVGSSSLIASCGQSSESRNVCLWDTLLPQRSSLIQAFTCHLDGSSALVYAPQHQVLISAGKKGDICIIDVRQRQVRQTFQAHDSAIRTLALDVGEQQFVTGAADGDIKVWGLTVHNLIHCFQLEHSKGSIFRNTGVGVNQVHLGTSNHLYSSGADGSMKVRRLPRRDLLVHSLLSSSMASFQ